MMTANKKEDDIRFLMQAKFRKYDVLMQLYLDAKMTKRCVMMAYRSEIGEKEVKTSLVELLLNVLGTRVKVHVHGQDPVYASPSPHMQNLKT